MGRTWVVSELHESVKEYFEYRDGNLFWKKCDAKWVKVGSLVGSLRKDGYRMSKFKGKKWLVHRLIYLWHYGELPAMLDHIDKNPENNRIENLRPTDKRLNGYNRNAPVNSSSGVPGVSWDTKQQKWAVRFKKNGKYEFHGYYSDKEEAIYVRKKIQDKEVIYE